jgi:DNA-binding CsgD family transcriptional regulator
MTQPVNDLLVQSRFKNRILFDVMAGRPVREIAAASGVHEHTIYALLSLSLSPVVKDGTYRTGAQKLAEFFRMLPEDLFPASLYALNLPRVVEREYSSEVILKRLSCREALALPAPDGFKTIEEEERATMIRKLLKTLTPREEKVIRMRFGMDEDSEQSLRAVGDSLLCSPERIRQVEAKALRKLRHPSRSSKLRGFLGASRKYF